MEFLEYLKKNEMTLSGFSRKFDIPLQTLRRVKDRQSLTLFTAAKIRDATFYNVDWTDLLTPSEIQQLSDRVS